MKLPPSVSVARAATDLPGPLPAGSARTVKIDLEAELVGTLANETTYVYRTFNGKVPGPFLRVRVGDTVELGFKSRADSRMIHSVDLHAVTGPGGGADDSDPSGRIEVVPVQGHQPGPVRVSLRDADGREPHLERDVRAHPGGAAGRPAQGRSRVLRHAG